MSETSETPGGADGAAFWQFSLTVYVRPGVAEACIGLQDRKGLDVNLLLFCCWAGSRGRSLSAAEIEMLCSAVGAWHREVVRPLRSVRRWLKGREDLAAAEAGALRADIKAKELEAERIEQRLLAEALPFDAATPDPVAAADNLLAYLGALESRPDEMDKGDLATLLAAALPSLTPQEAARLLDGG